MSDAERQQLLSDNIFAPRVHKESALATGDGGETMAQPANPSVAAILGLPIALGLFVMLLATAFSGFVVVPPGELMVVVTLV